MGLSLSVRHNSNMRIIIDKTSDHPNIFDTSELLRPEEALKEKEAFRDYSKDDVIGERVRRTYYEMQTNQTVEFVIVNHMNKVGTKIPREGLWGIRLHSCYPWHTGKDYTHLMAPGDQQIMDWVLEFNKYDLYTKSTQVPDVTALKPYYQTLIDKYLPGSVSF